MSVCNTNFQLEVLTVELRNSLYGRKLDRLTFISYNMANVY